MEQNKALGSPSTFYRILRKAKVIPPQIGDAYITPNGYTAKLSHLHVTDPNKVDVEEMLPDTDQPVVKTYHLSDLKPLTPRPRYCATPPHSWDVDVAISAAHKSVSPLVKTSQKHHVANIFSIFDGFWQKRSIE
jgi:hypothetical protein